MLVPLAFVCWKPDRGVNLPATGAWAFLPFLVVDIVVAAITNAVGMMRLPPVVISTPLKLLLFLMVDGWHLLVGALVRSFQ